MDDEISDGKDLLTEAQAKAFDYEFLHPKATPLGVPAVADFDWEVLRRNLGEAAADMGPTDYALLAQTLGELMRWVVKGDLRNLKAIGRRAVSLAWVMDPSLFDGSPTAEKLARRVGCHAVTMWRETKAASRAFGVRNRGQKRPANGPLKRLPASPVRRGAKSLPRPRALPVRPARR